jgi:hypothetical protein
LAVLGNPGISMATAKCTFAAGPLSIVSVVSTGSGSAGGRWTQFHSVGHFGDVQTTLIGAIGMPRVAATGLSGARQTEPVALGTPVAEPDRRR